MMTSLDVNHIFNRPIAQITNLLHEPQCKHFQTSFFNFNFGHDFNFKLLGATSSTNNKGLHVLLHQNLKQILMSEKRQHCDHLHCLST